MGIRSEFEKAFDNFRTVQHKNYPNGFYISKYQIRTALWAAKWMGEFIATKSGFWGKDDLIIQEILALIKDLDNQEESEGDEPRHKTSF